MVQDGHQARRREIPANFQELLVSQVLQNRSGTFGRQGYQQVLAVFARQLHQNFALIHRVNPAKKGEGGLLVIPSY